MQKLTRPRHGVGLSILALLASLVSGQVKADTLGPFDIFLNAPLYSIPVYGTSGGTLNFEMDVAPLGGGLGGPGGSVDISVSSNDPGTGGVAGDLVLSGPQDGPPPVTITSFSYGDITGNSPVGPNYIYDKTQWSVTINSADLAGLPIFIAIDTSGLGCPGGAAPGGYCLDPTLTITSTGGLSFSPNTATTPLPAALPLFASGLGLIGWIGRRRKRRS
jgi:hypothetical protein